MKTIMCRYLLLIFTTGLAFFVTLELIEKTKPLLDDYVLNSQNDLLARMVEGYSILGILAVFILISLLFGMVIKKTLKQ